MSSGVGLDEAGDALSGDVVFTATERFSRGGTKPSDIAAGEKGEGRWAGMMDRRRMKRKREEKGD